jgi:uncharacterized membrane-anchored protein
MLSIQSHPLRETLSHELHARPFPQVDAPCQVAYMALTSTDADEDDIQSLAHIMGGVDYVIGSGHYYEIFENFALKWERHSEFVTYTVFVDGEEESPFSDVAADCFPTEWMDSLRCKILTAVKLRLENPTTKKQAEQDILVDFHAGFQSESLAISYVLDENAVVASDFKMDEEGYIRFGVLPIGQVGRNRLGRILQRLLEIETYRAMSMLTLPIAKKVFSRLTHLESDLAREVQSISGREGTHRERLTALMSIAAEIEYLNAENAFRFGAGEAYAALVDQRIFVLREERFLGRQTFAEFMMRRFSPTVRTCAAAQKRLQSISDRAARAADLLGTRVNVRAAEQNRVLLEKMDARAELQLRLQETVEGLSVVAISYYGVSLLTYLLVPFAKPHGWDKTYVSALMVLPVIFCVMLLVRRIRANVGKHKI